MNVKDLFSDINIIEASPHLEKIDVAGISCNSKEASRGVLFIAMRGPSEDGHCYIEDAVRRNASAIVFDDPAFLKKVSGRIPYIFVEHSKLALAKIADAFFSYPYQKIRSVGITGTNGKTTVTYLIKSILNAAGIKCGLIGTIGYRIDEANTPLSNTTPGVIELHKLLKEMVEAGDQYVVMEVSSHALDQERVAGMVFKAAIFTNLTQDHLDYHKDMEGYFYAKQRLFKEHSDKKTNFIINGDDPFGRRLLASLGGKKISYGFSPDSDVNVTDFKLDKDKSRIMIQTPLFKFNISTKLIGKHNIYNILAAVSFGLSEGFDLEAITKGIEAVRFVPGRLDRVESKRGFSVFIDYAHTEDALKNVLESLRAILHNGRIITVFGCGGDRDKDKRPKMGRVASILSDYCIVTSDNPRSEDPEAIIAQITEGMEKKNFQVEEDRALAITKALAMAKENDFVLVAGKGHEPYQIIKDKVLPFDDKMMVLKIISETY